MKILLLTIILLSASPMQQKKLIQLDSYFKTLDTILTAYPLLKHQIDSSTLQQLDLARQTLSIPENQRFLDNYYKAKIEHLDKSKTNVSSDINLDEEVNLGIFAAVLHQKLMSFIKELITLKTDKTPILVSEVKISLKYALFVKSYLINNYIYKDIISVLPDNLDPATRKNVSQLIIGVLEKYSIEYIKKLLKDKANIAIKKDLRRAKSLESILPDSSDAILAILLQKNIEDTKHPNHPGAAPNQGVSKQEYVESVKDWAWLVQDSMQHYKNHKKINTVKLLKTIEAEFSDEKYDPALYNHIYKVLRNYLRSFDAVEIEGTIVASTIADAFSSIKPKDIVVYYNYDLYKNINDNDFDGSLFPPAATFAHWLNEAIIEVPYNDAPEYRIFQEKLSAWTKDVIKTINSVENQDTLFYAGSYRQKLGILSSNYGDIDPLMSLVMYHLKSATTKIERGDLLSDLIGASIDELDSLARSHNYRMADQWQEQKFSFPLKFSSQLKSLFEEVKAQASFDDYQIKIDQWTTASKDLVLDAKSSSWSDNTTFKTKDLSQELEYLFTKDINGLEGLRFIYEQFLKTSLAKESNTVTFKNIQNIWRDAMENAQLDKILKKQYTSYTKNYYPEDVEELIDSMEFIFPSTKDLKAALSVSRNSAKRRPLSIDTSTLVVNYQLNWEPRKTLVEIAATEVHNEIPGGDDLTEKTKWLLDWFNDKIQSGTLDELKELGGNLLAATFRTNVAPDDIQLHLPFKVSKTYKNGKSIVFADLEPINNGTIRFQKNSPYSLDRIDINKVGQTKFENNTAIHQIRMVLDVDDMALAKNISANAQVAGAEVGLAIAPQKHTLAFELFIHSTLENEVLNIQVVPRTSTVPSTEDCPLLEGCTGPGSNILRLNPFSE